MATTKKSQAKEEPTKNKWEQLLDDMNYGSGGVFFHPKVGKFRLKIVPEDLEDDESWFREVQTSFRGTKKTKFMLRCVIVDASTGELSENYKNKIIPFIASKTAMKQIIGLLAEGYDLFDPEEGHGITYSRQGENFNTTYSVVPSPKPVVLDMEEIEVPEETMTEWVEQYTQREVDRQFEADDDDNSSPGETGW